MATHLHGRSRNELVGRAPARQRTYSHRAILRGFSSVSPNSRGATSPKRVAVVRHAIAKATVERRSLIKHISRYEGKNFPDTSPLRPSLYKADDSLRRAKGVLKRLKFHRGL